jgi:hypothetical protein
MIKERRINQLRDFLMMSGLTGSLNLFKEYFIQIKNEFSLDIIKKSEWQNMLTDFMEKDCVEGVEFIIENTDHDYSAYKSILVSNMFKCNKSIHIIKMLFFDLDCKPTMRHFENVKNRIINGFYSKESSIELLEYIANYPDMDIFSHDGIFQQLQWYYDEDIVKILMNSKNCSADGWLKYFKQHPEFKKLFDLSLKIDSELKTLNETISKVDKQFDIL